MPNCQTKDINLLSSKDQLSSLVLLSLFIVLWIDTLYLDLMTGWCYMCPKKEIFLKQITLLHDLLVQHCVRLFFYCICQSCSVKLPFYQENVCLALEKEYSLYAVGSQSHICFLDSRTTKPVGSVCSKDEGAGQYKYRDNLVCSLRQGEYFARCLHCTDELMWDLKERVRPQNVASHRPSKRSFFEEKIFLYIVMAHFGIGTKYRGLLFAPHSFFFTIGTLWRSFLKVGRIVNNKFTFHSL